MLWHHFSPNTSASIISLNNPSRALNSPNVPSCATSPSLITMIRSHDLIVASRCEINLQWKGTDACYDFYCSCNPEEPQHFDGEFGDLFTCGNPSVVADDEEAGESRTYCAKTWRLPHTISEGIEEVSSA